MKILIKLPPLCYPPFTDEDVSSGLGVGRETKKCEGRNDAILGKTEDMRSSTVRRRTWPFPCLVLFRKCAPTVCPLPMSNTF